MSIAIAVEALSTYGRDARAVAAEIVRGQRLPKSLRTKSFGYTVGRNR